MLINKNNLYRNKLIKITLESNKINSIIIILEISLIAKSV